MPFNSPEEPRPPYTLAFRIGSIPVTVEPWFWLVTLLMGLSGGLDRALSWVVVVFISVLIHELGHATAAMAFGSPTRIRLYSFGGLTYHHALPRLQSVLVSLAGPFAGFAMGFLLIMYERHAIITDPRVAMVLGQAEWVNIAWGIMNLLPVLPLDGGHVMQGILGERRFRLTRMISIGVGALVVAWAIKIGERYLAMLFAYFVMNSIRALQEGPTHEPVYRVRRPVVLKSGQEEGLLQDGWAKLFAGDSDEAERASRRVLIESSDVAFRNRAIDLAAWVMLARSDAFGALRQLERIQPQTQVRSLTYAMTLELAEQSDRALEPAFQAHKEEPSEATAQLVIRLLTRADRFDEALRVAESAPWKRTGLKEAALSDLHAARGDYPKAVTFAQQAFEKRQRPADAIQAARHLARSGDASGALSWIQRALGAGYSDVEALTDDPDFESVRSLPGFPGAQTKTAATG